MKAIVTCIVFAVLGIYACQSAPPPPDRGAGRDAPAARPVADGRAPVARSAGTPAPPSAATRGAAERPAVKVEQEVLGVFPPSGWMGDAADPANQGVLEVRESEFEPFEGPTCQEWIYRPSKGTLGWVAVAYQFPENNWGDKPGKDLSGKGFTKLSFAARGHDGGEMLIVSTGGNTKPDAKFQASYERSLGTIRLTKNWKVYTISLDGLDTSQTVSAITFSSNKELTKGDAIRFYFDSIKYSN